MMSHFSKKPPTTMYKSLFTFASGLLKHLLPLIYLNIMNLSDLKFWYKKPALYIEGSSEPVSRLCAFRVCMRRSDNRQLGRTRGELLSSQAVAADSLDDRSIASRSHSHCKSKSLWARGEERRVWASEDRRFCSRANGDSGGWGCKTYAY